MAQAALIIPEQVQVVYLACIAANVTVINVISGIWPLSDLILTYLTLFSCLCKSTGSKNAGRPDVFCMTCEDLLGFYPNRFWWSLWRLITLKLLTFFLLSQANHPLLTVSFRLDNHKGFARSTFNWTCGYISAFMIHLSYFVSPTFDRTREQRLRRTAPSSGHCW